MKDIWGEGDLKKRNTGEKGKTKFPSNSKPLLDITYKYKV